MKRIIYPTPSLDDREFKAIANDPLVKLTKRDDEMGFDIEGIEPAEQGQIADGQIAQYIEWCSPGRMFRFLGAVSNIVDQFANQKQQIADWQASSNRMERRWQDSERNRMETDRKYGRVLAEKDRVQQKLNRANARIAELEQGVLDGTAR